MKLKKQSFSNKMKGGEFIPTYTETSPGWHNANSNVPFAVDLNAGVNEYVFSRTTPNNKFVVEFNGESYKFPNLAAANKFKAAAGIR